jgi:hypothetical protein
MIKLSDVVKDILSSNPWFEFGIVENLFNLTSLSKFIQPQVEVRLKRKVSNSSILMAISRLLGEFEIRKSYLPNFKFDNLTLVLGLSVCSFDKSEKTHKLANQIYNHIYKKKGLVNLTEGIGEINIIFETKFRQDFVSGEFDQAKFMKDDLAAVIVKFNEEYMNTPGFVFSVIKSLFIQNINIIETTSTYTELIFYVDKSEAKLAFNSLYYYLENQ